MVRVVVLVLLAAVAAVNAQKPVCYPDQFMGGLGFTIGQVGPDKTPVGFTLNEYGAWDFANRRIGINYELFYPNGTFYKFRLIQEYAQGIQWVIYEQFRFCAKQPAPRPEASNCLPPNSTAAYSGFIGGEKGVYYDAYNFKLTKEESITQEGDLTVTVVKDSNIPLSYSFIGVYYDGDNAYDQVSSGGFYNVEMGIPDPRRWFEVPSFCQEATTDMSKLPKHIRIPNFSRLPMPRVF